MRHSAAAKNQKIEDSPPELSSRAWAVERSPAARARTSLAAGAAGRLRDAASRSRAAAVWKPFSVASTNGVLPFRLGACTAPPASRATMQPWWPLEAAKCRAVCSARGGGVGERCWQECRRSAGSGAGNTGSARRVAAGCCWNPPARVHHSCLLPPRRPAGQSHNRHVPARRRRAALHAQQGEPEAAVGRRGPPQHVSRQSSQRASTRAEEGSSTVTDR